MGVLDKFLDAIKLNDDYDDDELLDDSILEEEDDYEDDFLDDEDDMEEKPKKKFFEKFSKKKSEEEDFLDEDEPEEESVKSAPAKVSAKTAAAKAPVKQERAARPAPSSKITPMRTSKRSSQTVNMEVCVIKPTTMEEAREIADTLVDNSTVILNLEGIDVELAQRIIDFTSGACYSLGGSLQQVSSYIFVLGPYNVDITGDLQNILGGSVPSVRVGY
ncbi:MAG: cell division protein SepF [Eubacteriales bacterium]|nr:cell division protein SepF [Eubacteriales bacterium]